MDFTAEAAALHDGLVALRRELHARPETDTDTVWTADRIAAELDTIDVPYTRLPDKQLVGRIGSGASPSIALRADMDGLPITEDTGLPFASTNATMHACGHDGHRAMLVGAARLLKGVQDALNGTVHLCFQSAEETGRGWDRILNHLGDVGGVDQAIALHLWADVDSGTISVVSGPRMAGVERFDITITGRGGHGSRPDDPRGQRSRLGVAGRAGHRGHARPDERRVRTDRGIGELPSTCRSTRGSWPTSGSSALRSSSPTTTIRSSTSMKTSCHTVPSSSHAMPISTSPEVGRCRTRDSRRPSAPARRAARKFPRRSWNPCPPSTRFEARR